MILDELASTHRITWEKVKGHSDHPYNNRCDKLAVQAIKQRNMKELAPDV